MTPEACKKLSADARIELARKALFSKLTQLAAQRVHLSERGHRVDPKRIAKLKIEELQFVSSYPEEAGIIEFFDFKTPRAPGFVWSITLFEDCETDLGFRWDST